MCVCGPPMNSWKFDGWCWVVGKWWSQCIHIFGYWLISSIRKHKSPYFVYGIKIHFEKIPRKLRKNYYGGLISYYPDEKGCIGPETQVPSSKRRLPGKPEPLRICITYFLLRHTTFFFFFYLNFYEIKDVIKFHVFEMGIWSTNRGRTGTRLFLFPFPMPSTFSSVAKFGVKTSMSPGERRMRCFVVYAKY